MNQRIVSIFQMKLIHKIREKTKAAIYFSKIKICAENTEKYIAMALKQDKCNFREIFSNFK